MEILFKEKQKVDSIWPLSILATVLVFNWFLYFRMGYTDITFFYICLSSFGILSLYLGTLRMETEIDANEIRYKLFPFKSKWQTIPLNQIKSLEVRSYKAFKEFGGRGSRTKRGQSAITLAGNQGLQIHFKSNQKLSLLIGTLKPDEIKEVISKLNLK